jgi:hypothetical protein
MNRIADLAQPQSAPNTLPHRHDAPRNFIPPSAPLEPRTLQLDIVTGNRCAICQSFLPTLEGLRTELPNVNVTIIDIDAPGTVVPPNVIAIPTILLNGHIVATGNPAYEDLKQFIRSLAN